MLKAWHFQVEVWHMKEEGMWRDIGPEKTALLKSHGFKAVGTMFVDPASRRNFPFSIVADETVSRLRSALESSRSKTRCLFDR
jgi:hypothetical protein